MLGLVSNLLSAECSESLCDLHTLLRQACLTYCFAADQILPHGRGRRTNFGEIRRHGYPMESGQGPYQEGGLS